ncbi:hypothetical protein [Acinetobacter sp. ANC 4862]|uniref:hypothetical protein n=1 Tax=Acinetobacter sp. ANC 4862 TaxID=2529849 RepID=UPI00103FD0C2|nr:hypothetical protein [Acinetobacter sp. ANC 4862]TCH60706.1 hypothetical protein E0409_15925 [Acinetobacter sp. ANC 4862]
MRIQLISLINSIKTSQGYCAEIGFEFSNGDSVNGSVDFTYFADESQWCYDLGHMKKFLTRHEDKVFVDEVLTGDHFIDDVRSYVEQELTEGAKCPN